LASRADIFPEYTPDGFEAAFVEQFVIHRRDRVGDSGRWLYWLERRT
jgi:hypothetical protein